MSQPSNKAASELDKVIPPEINNDELYRWIEKLGREEKIKTALEIGSSSGEGSTRAFVQGLSANPNNPKLFCLEVSKPRFAALQDRYKDQPWVNCLNMSAVPLTKFPSAQQVEEFYKTKRTVLNNYPLQQVLGWLQQDIDYITEHGVDGQGVAKAKELAGVKTFDLVLIDGSEFSGEAELDAVYGSRLIVLDDILGYKTFAARKRLLADPNYMLIAENFNVRNGYSIFKRREIPLPIHFFTIVLNGEPFIRHHIEALSALPFNWHWHIVEGTARLVRDTAWSIHTGGKVPDEFATGLSNDGTTNYLDELAQKYPANVTVYRKPVGELWDGKVEMVNAPIPNIQENCLLWQLDSDELWTAEQISKMRDMFIANPDRTGAYTHCWYFVGANKYVSSMNTWSTFPYDWPRVWQFKPGYTWRSHEPAALVDQQGTDLIRVNPFSAQETKDAGLSFMHFSYAIEEQVRFKEVYYGYPNAVEHWKRLQEAPCPLNVADFLPWSKSSVIEEWPASDSSSPGLSLLRKFLEERGRLSRPGQNIKIAGQDDTSGKDLTQIDDGSSFAEAIREVVRTHRPRKIIETGTYLGTGTTKIIASALKEFAVESPEFYSIEVNPNNFIQAQTNLANAGLITYVRALLGVSVPRTMLPTIAELEERFVRNIQFSDCYIDHKEHERAILYYKETDFQGIPEDLLRESLAKFDYKPDFVLLDSGGHMGNVEFNYLLSLLKGPCHIALDDVFHVKHALSFKQMKSDPRFKIITHGKEKFGFAVAEFDPARRAVSPSTNVVSTKPAPSATSASARKDTLAWVRSDSIGDAVLSCGMLGAVAKHFPETEIVVICQEHIAELYKHSPFVTSVVAFNRKSLENDLAYRADLVAKLEAIKASIVIHSTYSRDVVGDFLALATGAAVRIAPRGDCSNTEPAEHEATLRHYTKIVEIDPGITSELGRHKAFLKELGIDYSSVKPSVWIGQTERDWADNFFKANGLSKDKTLLLFAGAQHHLRHYQGYGEAIAAIANKQGLTVVALGAAEDRDLTAKNLSKIQGKTFNLCGQTSLLQAAAIIDGCRAAIGAETGLMHMACALEVPNAVLLGGGHFGRFMPYAKTTTIAASPVECIGCNWKCKFSQAHCVTDLAPSKLSEALESALSKGPQKIFWQNNGDSAQLADRPTISQEVANRLTTEFAPEQISRTNTTCTNNSAVKVSAIVPVLPYDNNVAQNLRGIISDLTAQTLWQTGKLEIVISDPNLNPPALAGLKAELANEPRIRWGTTTAIVPSLATEAAISAAQGDIVIPCTMSDRHHPNAFEKLVNVIEQKQVGVSYCDLIPGSGKPSTFATAGNARWNLPDYKPELSLHYGIGIYKFAAKKSVWLAEIAHTPKVPLHYLSEIFARTTVAAGAYHIAETLAAVWVDDEDVIATFGSNTDDDEIYFQRITSLPLETIFPTRNLSTPRSRASAYATLGNTAMTLRQPWFNGNPPTIKLYAAELWYKKAIKEDPSFVPAKYNLALLCAFGNDLVRAKSMIVEIESASECSRQLIETVKKFVGDTERGLFESKSQTDVLLSLPLISSDASWVNHVQ